jgi:hypothetical protein
MMLFSFVGYTTATLAQVARIGCISDFRVISISAHICDSKLKCSTALGLADDNCLARRFLQD